MLAQVVTTVWGTKLGTKLLNGFNSTTDDTAYFRCLLLNPGSLNSTMPPSSSPVWSRHPGRLLLTYGLGRGIEYYDAPAIRKIVRETREQDFRFSSIVQGIVSSTPFQMRRSQ